MRPPHSTVQRILYRVFLVSGGIATLIGLAMIWGLEPEHRDSGMLLVRVLGTCVVVALASGLTLSATRVVEGPPPEDDRG
ncbi:MAG TPA: hypothetical protein VFZ65_03975 [Planctomycetota bacterium]|nr:hypothetical protein [Planctomycetota bacterium]